MTTSTYDILIVTNRKIAGDNFISKIKKIASSNAKAVVLREKDLKEDEYFSLAKKIIKICKDKNKNLILHNFVDIAIKLSYDKIHIPLLKLENLSEKEKSKFRIIGASCHSVEDAIKAEKLGANYIFAGHIYETDSKKGLKGRGTEFLAKVCNSVKIPVYAIGGITKDNIKDVRNTGANGAVIMSSAMKTDDIDSLLEKLRKSNYKL